MPLSLIHLLAARACHAGTLKRALAADEDARRLLARPTNHHPAKTRRTVSSLHPATAATRRSEIPCATAARIALSRSCGSTVRM